MNESVVRLTKRAAVDPYFLAFALAEYAAAGNLDDAALAAALGTTPDVLAHIRLCPAPRADAEGFGADVERVATKFGLNRDVLTAAARQGQVIAEMRAAAERNPEAAGKLLAARDRKPS
ncbi:hypothetical protein J0H58_32325 [bacterium]|nr:hypothetical protein [bacterium]